MSPLALSVLLLVIATPIAWFTSEFQERRWLRVALGSAAIAMCFGVAFLAGKLEMFNANAWFGYATKELVDTTIAELEAGHHDRVLVALKQLQRQYSPTYENRARYDELAAQASRICGAKRQDARLFDGFLVARVVARSIAQVGLSMLCLNHVETNS